LFDANRFQIEQDDLIYNDMWARMGSVAIVPPGLGGAVASSHFPTFLLDESKVISSYLSWYFRTPTFWDDCENASRGSTGRNQIKLRTFAAIHIPLPPLDEQRRIVARIESVAAKVEEARELRNQLFEETNAISASAAHDLFSARRMKGAPVTPLENIAEIRAGVTLGRALIGNTVRLPYLRVANVQDGRLDLRVLKEIEIYPEECEKWQLARGDLLLTEGGDWDKLGRGTVWQDEVRPCIHQNHIFRVRLNQTRFDPWYVSALVSSPRGKEFFQAASKQTTNLASINQRQLKSFPVFDLPLKKQREIVSELANIQTKIVAVKALQAETAAELDAMLPAILDKAFKGEL
jgi:type I restriction enzyme, S subunit